HPEAVPLDDEVIIGRLVFDEQPVLEAAASARLNAHAQAAFLDRNALGLHEPQHFGGRHRRYDERQGGLLCRAHCQTSSTVRRGGETISSAATYARNIALQKPSYKQLTAGGTIR